MKGKQHSTCLASCDRCAAELLQLQPAASELVRRSSTCERTGQMQLDHECTTRADLLLDQMQTPHAAVVVLRLEVH